MTAVSTDLAEALGPFDTRIALGATLDDLDLEMFRSTYLPAMVGPESIAEKARPVGFQLASLHLAQGSGDQVPTMLGLLAIGLDPSSRIPGAYVQFVRYQGTDLTAPIADERELRGNVVDVANRLSPLVWGHVRSRLVSDGGFREDRVPDYPIEALREICMNSLMHRNYETSNAPVRILWFDDRVEVSNPGGPFGQVRSDNFDRVTDYRNPSLAAAMKALGYVNRFGRGIGRVRESLRRNNNPEPEFVVDESSWTVTVRKQHDDGHRALRFERIPVGVQLGGARRGPVEDRSHEIATLRNCLMPLAHVARKSMFDLPAADGALGSTQTYIKTCFQEFWSLAE